MTVKREKLRRTIAGASRGRCCLALLLLLLVSPALAFLPALASARDATAAAADTTNSVGDVRRASSTLEDAAATNPLVTASHCNITGQCVKCTPEEQNQDPACRPTGYRQQVTCVERYSTAATAATEHGGSRSSAVAVRGTTGLPADDAATSAANAAARQGQEGSSGSSSEGAEGAAAAASATPATVEKGTEEDAGTATAGSKAGRRRLLDDSRRLQQPDDLTAAQQQPNLDGIRQQRLLAESSAGLTGSEDPSQSESSVSSGRRGAVGGAGASAGGDASGGKLEDDGGEVGAAAVAGQGTHGGHGRHAEEGGSGTELRHYVAYESCRLADREDSLSVVSFEAIMLAVLAVAAPVVYQRKRRTSSTGSVAMTRLTGSGRM